MHGSDVNLTGVLMVTYLKSFSKVPGTAMMSCTNRETHKQDANKGFGDEIKFKQDWIIKKIGK